MMRAVLAAVALLIGLTACSNEPEVSEFEKKEQLFQRYQLVAPAADANRWGVFAIDSHTDMVCDDFDNGNSLEMEFFKARSTGYSEDGASALIAVALAEKCPEHEGLLSGY